MQQPKGNALEMKTMTMDLTKTALKGQLPGFLPQEHCPIAKGWLRHPEVEDPHTKKVVLLTTNSSAGPDLSPTSTFLI